MRQSRMDNARDTGTLGNKTLDENKQNTTEKPIKMRAIKNGQSRKHWQHWEIRHWTETNKTQQRNL